MLGLPVGMLREGRAADLVVLDRSPFELDWHRELPRDVRVERSAVVAHEDADDELRGLGRVTLARDRVLERAELHRRLRPHPRRRLRRAQPRNLDHGRVVGARRSAPLGRIDRRGHRVARGVLRSRLQGPGKRRLLGCGRRGGLLRHRRGRLGRPRSGRIGACGKRCGQYKREDGARLGHEVRSMAHR
ncbi:MAG: hypothetical protein ACO3QC_14310 [Phycisphaerales bacterium]